MRIRGGGAAYVAVRVSEMVMVARNVGGSPWDPATRPRSRPRRERFGGMGTEDGARRPSRPLPRRLSLLLCLILVLFFVRPDFYSTPQASEEIIAPPQHTAVPGPPPQ